MLIKTPAKPLVLIHLTTSKLDARKKGVVPCKLSRLVTEGLLTGTKWVREANGQQNGRVGPYGHTMIKMIKFGPAIDFPGKKTSKKSEIIS